MDAQPASAQALVDSLELGYSMLGRAYYEADSLPEGMGMMFQSMEQMHTQMMRQRRQMASAMGQGMMGGGGMREQKGGQQGMHRRMYGADSTAQMWEWHQQMMAMHAQMAELHEQQGRNDLVAHHRQMERRHSRMMEAIPAESRAREPGADQRRDRSAETPEVDGRSLYATNCSTCHGRDGQGIGSFPPLAGSSWVGGDEDRLIRIVLHGLQGPIGVRGERYNGLMPAFGSRLTDREVAALLSYLRSSWGNDAESVDGEDVREVRKEFGARTRPWTASDLPSDDEG